MSASSKNVTFEEETSSISLMCYTKQDTENNDHIFLDDENQEKTGQVEKFRLIGEPHKFDELIDCIQIRDLERLKECVEKICKFWVFFILFLKIETYTGKWKLMFLFNVS